MRNLGIALALVFAVRTAAADVAAPPPVVAEPPASAAPAPVSPKLLDGTPKPKDIAIHETHHDGDHLGGRECAPNAMGQIVCTVPAPTTSHPTSTR